MVPYIGITDFTAPDEVQYMLAIFNSCKKPGTSRKLMVGIMMSYKTLNGIPNRWMDIFPPKEHIASLFYSDDAYNCLHYADYENIDPDLAATLVKAISYGGIGIHSLQLDMIWPDPVQIAKAVHLSRKPIDVILQVGRIALDRIQNSPKAMIEQLKPYEGVIHGVLLDKSMGTGTSMSELELRPFVEGLYKEMPSVRVAVAGGLGPHTLHLLGALPFDFPDISIDAQGKLRPSGDAKDPIDWSMAGDYVRRALRVLD